jgi:hypothetical protein
VAVTVHSGPAWTPNDPTCPAWTATWASICAVWASKWNHRAWLSRQSAGLPEEQLAVSVLIQQVSRGCTYGVRHGGVGGSQARGEEGDCAIVVLCARGGGGGALCPCSMVQGGVAPVSSYGGRHMLS